MRRQLSLAAASILAPAILILATCPGCHTGERSSAALTFEDAVTLQNAAVRVSISPGAGRVVEFGRPDGPNLLWINTKEGFEETLEESGWANYGGDKIWPSQQAQWRYINNGTSWPPDKAIDGAAWKLVEAGPLRAVIESPVSSYQYVKVRREFQLDQAEARLTIRNTVTQMDYSPFPAHIWSITQVIHPQFALLDVARDRPDANRKFFELLPPKTTDSNVTVLDQSSTVRYDAPAKIAAKVFTLGRWVAGVYEDVIFFQSVEFDRKACYVDGASTEVYSDERNMELETLSPALHLQPGQSIHSTVTWRLIERKKDLTAEQLAELLGLCN